MSLAYWYSQGKEVDFESKLKLSKRGLNKGGASDKVGFGKKHECWIICMKKGKNAEDVMSNNILQQIFIMY